MKILRKINDSIQTILYNPEYLYGNDILMYKESPFIHEYIYKNKRYIYNILTDEILEMDLNETLDYNYKIKNWYLLPKDLDPYTIAILAVKLNYSKQRTNFNLVNYKSFTIMTTTACNARCPYCFQKDCSERVMSKKTAEDVANYISSFFVSEPLGICWFGGEPTLNIDCINTISNILNNKNINFYSTIITNGFLLNTLSSYDMKYKWRTINVQVTLDGYDEYHNKIKNIKSNKNVFFETISGIDKCLENDIRVGVRLNISNDEEEFKSKKKLCEWLVKKYKNEEKLSITTSFVYDTPQKKFSTEERTISHRYRHELHSILKECDGFRRNSFLPSPQRDLSACLVQSQSGVCIDPDGNLQLCGHYTEPETRIGTIYKGINKLDIIKYSGAEIHIDKCKICKFSPICKYIQMCGSVPDCNNCNLSDMDINLNEYIENIVEGRHERDFISP